MNSASLVRFPPKATSARSAGQEVCRRRGSCRSSRRGRAVLSSTTACTAPRTRWRSSRARCRSGPSFLASFEARVCVSASACLLCVSALRGCLGREIKPHSVLRPLRTPGRPRAGAVTHSAQHARHTLCAQLRYIGQGGQVGKLGKVDAQGKSTRQIHTANPHGKSTRQIHGVGRVTSFLHF